MILDLLKRKIMFWKYKSISIELNEEDILFIKKSAKLKKISVDRFVEICLEHHIRNIK